MRGSKKKMTTVKNSDIWRAKGAFEKLAAEKLPVAVSYRLALLVQEIGKQYMVLTQVSDSLVRKYGTAKEEGGSPTVEQGSENFERFLAEFNEVLAEDFEMTAEQVTLPEEVSYTCSTCETVTTKPLELEPSMLIALTPFVKV